MSFRSVMVPLLVSAWLAPATTQATTYTVGSGWGCTHRTIQSAIDAARLHPGADAIRITNGSYVQQAIVISGQEELSIEGGYAACFSPSAGATRTRVDGAGGRAPVVSIDSSTVLMKGIELINGDSDSSGGGIAIGRSAYANATVTLQNVRIAQNSALDGAGAYVSLGSRLILDTDSLVEINNARRDGGGVVRSNVRVGHRRKFRGSRSCGGLARGQ